MAKFYDLKKVHELAEGDEDFTKILIDTFLEEIPEDLEGMSNAVTENNAKTAYQFAHKMKPNFTLFGIDVVKEVKILESWKEGKIPDEEAQPILDFIKTTAEKAIEQLKADFY